MANTQISYLYRDASNYKQYARVIIKGELSDSDVEIILAKLLDGLFFIPEQVGLENLQKRSDYLNDDDHVFHELYREDIRLVDAPATLSLTAKQLLRNFRLARWNVWKAYRKLWNQ